MATDSVRNGRPSGQFQTSKLPAIPSASPANDNRVVPLQLTSSKADKDGIFAGYRNSGGDFYESDDRMRIMETRLGVTEKSNRALLEEVIRLQAELRVMVRRNEEGLKDEKMSRQQMDSSMHIVNDLISKLSMRIKLAEDKINEERSALSSLVTHTKGVEKAVVAGQKNLVDRKDNQANKIQELSLVLSEVRQSRDQLEKQVFSLTEELHSVRSKVDGHGLDLSTTVNELKLRSRRLEEENKLQLEALRKQGNMYNTAETSTTHLRGQVETRLSELRDVVMELRTRQDQEANDRRNLEQTISSRVNTLQQGLGEQNRKREEAMHAMDMIHREKEHNAENDKLKLQGRMTESMEEVNKRLLTKEIKLREELQDKYTQLERLIQHEQQVRQKFEATMRDENDKRWQQLKKLTDEEAGVVKDSFQSERHKSKNAIQKLDESISLLEKQLSENKRQSDKVVAAEIKSRKLHEKTTGEKLEHLNEKLSLATASLQQAISGATGGLNSHAEKMRAEMKAMVNTSEQASTRAMTDMDARLQGVKQKVGALEQQIDGRISEATAILAQNLREKVESISLWQDVTSQTIRELNTSISGLPNDIYAVEERQKLLKSEMESRMTTETDARIREIESLKHEVSLLKNKRDPQAPTMQDLQETQTSVRKLAESIQTVKTVVGMKIQSEQKLRMEGLEDLQIQINRLKSQAGMYSAVNSTQPMYMRNDLESAFGMEDFLQHDITQDIPYGRSSFKQPTTRSENPSAAGYSSNGYASMYTKNRVSADPNQDGQRRDNYNNNNNNYNPNLGMNSARPLDTVSEDRDSQEDWNLLSAVAYGTEDQGNEKAQNESVAEDENNKPRSRAASNKSRLSQRGQTPSGRAPSGQGQQASNSRRPSWGSANGDDNKKEAGRASQASLGRRSADAMDDGNLKQKTPERAVTRNNSGMVSPHDEARDGSLKGAGRGLDSLGLGDDADTTPGRGSQPKNTLDWEPASPTGRESNVADEDMKGESKDEKEKEPMSNRLAWEPATPTNEAEVKDDKKRQDDVKELQEDIESLRKKLGGKPRDDDSPNRRRSRNGGEDKPRRVGGGYAY